MTLPNNLAVGINKDTEGYTVDFKILICIVFAVVLPVVLDACPLFVLNVLFKGHLVLVSAQSDDPNVFPSCVFGVLFKHKLVVSHYRLAGRAPGGPEVKKDNLAGLVLYGRCCGFIEVT